MLIGWLWFLGMLVPVIGLVQVGSQTIADRYSYLPQIGLYIAVAWTARYVSQTWAFRGLLLGSISMLAMLGLLSCAWRQAAYWIDDEALWRHTLACTAENYFAHGALGTVLAERGRVDEAIDHFQKAVHIRPAWELARCCLGAALARRGRTDEAIAQYQAALRIEPDYEEAHVNLAIALVREGQIAQAITHYEEAIRIKLQ